MLKGDVFLALEDFITNVWGFELWEQIAETAAPQLSTREPFVGPGAYPDTDFQLIFAASASKLGTAPSYLARLFGRHLFHYLHKKLSKELEKFPDLRTLLRGLEAFVRTEIRKVHPDAQTPKFQVVAESDSSLSLRYSSPRRLYDLVEGLMEGAAEHFKESISVAQVRYENTQQGVCDFVIKFLDSEEA